MVCMFPMCIVFCLTISVYRCLFCCVSVKLLMDEILRGIFALFMVPPTATNTCSHGKGLKKFSVLWYQLLWQKWKKIDLELMVEKSWELNWKSGYPDENLVLMWPYRFLTDIWEILGSPELLVPLHLGTGVLPRKLLALLEQTVDLIPLTLIYLLWEFILHSKLPQDRRIEVLNALHSQASHSFRKLYFVSRIRSRGRYTVRYNH